MHTSSHRNNLPLLGAGLVIALAAGASLRRSRGFTWRNKVVVVAGGSRGLGLVLARQLTAMGAVQELQKTQALLLSQGRTQDAQEVTMALRALQSGDSGAAEKTLMGTMVNLDQGKK